MDTEDTELTTQEEHYIEEINCRWNDLPFLQEYMNEKLGVNPTSLYEAWEILFPSLYPWIKRQIDEMTDERLLNLIEHKNSEYYFPRSSGYNTLNDFSNVVRKVKFYGVNVDVYFDIFDVDFLYERIRRRKEREQLYLIYLRCNQLCKDLYRHIRKYI